MKKVILYTLISLFFIVAICLFFASTIAKSYINKNGEDIIGRKININKININYATVSLNVNEFTLYEKNKIDTFISFNKMHINIQPWKLLKNEYALSAFSLDGLFVMIEQDNDSFNFDDMIPPSDSSQTDTDTNTSSDELKFYLENISFTNGNIIYYDKSIDSKNSFHNLNLNLPLLAWNNEQSEMGLNLNIGDSGLLIVDADIFSDLEKYTINTKIKSLDIKSFSNYLHPYLNTDEINGILNSEIQFNGSLKNYMNIILSGNIIVNDFLLPDDKGNLVVSSESMHIKLDSIDVLNEYYDISRFDINDAIMNVELNPQTSNLEYLLAPIMAEDTTLTADSNNVSTTEDTISMFYLVRQFNINNAQINIIDNTLNRPFNYNISSFDIAIDDIYEENQKIPVRYDMVLNNRGVLNGNANFSILNPYLLNVDAELKKLELSSFSPYSEYYIAHPISQGDFNYKCSVEMTDQKLKNDNKIRINEFEFGDKTDDTTAIKSPVKLALYILKDKNDNIAFDIPVWGNPSDPDFAMGKLIWKTFWNFIVKTASEPFSALSSIAGTNPESIELIEFEPTQDTLSEKHIQSLDAIANILNTKPELVFSFSQETSQEIELKEIARMKISIDYLFHKFKPQTSADSIKLYNNWQSVNINDTAFISFCNSISKSDNTDIYEKCIAAYDMGTLISEYESMIARRNKAIKSYMLNKGIKEENIEVKTADLDNIRIQHEKPIFRVEVSIN